MYVKDYDFVTRGIDELFKRKIIIYGAKTLGAKIAQQLEDANIEIGCFCDRDKNQNLREGYTVIDIDDLKSEVQKADCLIIVASERYCDEIIEELQEKEIDSYVCTWYGFQIGVELNIEDERFPAGFREDVSEKRDLRIELNELYSYQIGWFNELHRQWYPILVYQPGKVGSSTIFTTLAKKGMEVAFLHHMVSNYLIDTVMEEPMERNIAYFRKKFGGG